MFTTVEIKSAQHVTRAEIFDLLLVELSAILSLCVTGKNHKVTCFEKCPDYSRKFMYSYAHVYYPLDAVYKCPAHQVLHILNS